MVKTSGHVQIERDTDYLTTQKWVPKKLLTTHHNFKTYRKLGHA